MAEYLDNTDIEVSVQLEHHVLERPMIRRTRRRPSTVTLILEDAPGGMNDDEHTHEENENKKPLSKKPLKIETLHRTDDENNKGGSNNLMQQKPPALPWKDPELQQRITRVRAKSNRKWAQLLGCPIDEAQLKPAREAALRVAKQHGAKITDVEFILEFTKTAELIENLQLQNKRPLDATQKRLLGKSDDSSSKPKQTTSKFGNSRLALS